MKKLLLSAALIVGMLSASASDQCISRAPMKTTVMAADTADYVGKYRYEGLPFEYMTISVKEGRFYFSGGEYAGYMEPVKDMKDVFDAGGIATFTFARNSDNKVVELAIDYQGQTYTGRKEE